VLIVLSALLVSGDAEVYIVTVEGEPIISYTGGIDGFKATAVESDEEIDTTRYLHSFLSTLSTTTKSCSFGKFLPSIRYIYF